ncbi:MAG: hypothetical protein JNL05_11760 [Flavobacteriales bacterium]|nr:hypothetical protein [Flavobacteriales bacterium]
MTLTLLLQLTDEEQLYAQSPPEPAPVTTEAPAPAAEEALEVEITAGEVG